MAEQKNPVPVEEEEESGLDIGVILHDMVRGFLKYWFVVLALVLVLGLYGMYKSVSSYRPLYRCQASFTVVATDVPSGSSTYYNRQAASTLKTAFPHFLGTDIMQDLMREDLGVSYINGSITADSLAESNLFTLTVISPDPQDAKRILEAVIDNSPEMLRIARYDAQLYMFDPPTLPEAPYNQMSWLGGTAKHAILGLALGIGFLLVYALTRNTVRREQDVESRLNQTCFAVIPQVYFKKRTGKVDTTISIFNEKTGIAFQESIRGLSLRVMGTMQEAEHKVLGVTGTVPGEGATTAAWNIAMALAESGKKVILLDGSFRAVRGKTDLPGLESYLEGSCELSDILVRDHKAHIFTVSCRRNMTAVELSRYTNQLQTLIQAARSVVDYVIVDIPPCQNVGEAATAIELCEGLLYVIRQDVVKMGRIMDTIEDLSRYDAKLYGCILNGAQSGLIGYGYGYGYNYSRYSYSRYGRYGSYGYGRYGYGYGEKKQ